MQIIFSTGSGWPTRYKFALMNSLLCGDPPAKSAGRIRRVVDDADVTAVDERSAVETAT